MKYAVVKIGASQFKVEKGDEIELDHLAGAEGSTVKFDKVLLVVDGGKVKIGSPQVKGVKLTAKIAKQFLGEKIHVFKFKAKTGYQRKTGFRPHKTLIKIESLTSVKS